MSRAGAVIVTWNSADVIGPCLDAALSRELDVVVVDNASTDGTLDEVRKRPRARWIANTTNRGFAAAVNQGIQELDAAYVLLLNPDAVLLEGAEALVAAVSEPGVGAAGGRLVDGGGRPQAGFMVRRFPTALALSFEVLGVNRLWRGNPVNRRYRCLDLVPEVRREVEQPAGAFLMIRREAWEAVGGFDEQFCPLWFEDVDFLKRLRDRGWRVMYEPAAAARHAGGHSAAKIARESRAVYWYGSLLRYVFKHFGVVGRGMVGAAVLVGSVLRMASEVIGKRSLDPIPVHGRVVRLAGRRFLSGRTGEGSGSPVLARR
mgnify:CR=1 FL=1